MMSGSPAPGPWDSAATNSIPTCPPLCNPDPVRRDGDERSGRARNEEAAKSDVAANMGAGMLPVVCMSTYIRG